MKVLLINNDKGWGGGQEFIMELSGELLKLGVDVHLVVRADSISHKRFENLGMPLYPMPSHGIQDLLALWNLAAIMRRERFDIISINREHDILATVLARSVAFPFSAPGKLIMTYHLGIVRKQHFLGYMDTILCVSEHVRNKLLEFHPHVASMTRVLHNGIKVSAPSAEKFSSDRARRYFLGIGFPLIGMVGAFWKNQAELVECIPLLKKDFPDIKVAFVGDDKELPLITPLKEKIRALGVEKSVIFTGKIPREQLADLYFDLDLSVTTHRNEGFGIVHLESLAAGTPVVAYNVGGQVDILAGGEVGELVDGGCLEFAAAISDLLKDHKRRFAMGIKGYELVKNRFSVECMGENYYSLFFRLLQDA